MEDQQPRVGIGVMILKDGKVLLGKRKGSHGAGEYAFPGGHLEHLESFEDCARREVQEECGVEIISLRFQFVANVTTYAPKHYVHLGFIANWQRAEPQVFEPDSCDSWEWYAPESLPEPLFEMARLAIESWRSGRSYYDA